jgi:hypothetical protein
MRYVLYHFTVAYYVLFFVIAYLKLHAQQATIRGTILDESGEPVVGATVSIPALQTGSVTNVQGIFSLSRLPAGSHEVKVNYFGYADQSQNVTVADGQIVTITIKLKEPGGKQLEAIEITAEENNLKIESSKPGTGLTRIGAKEIGVIPTLGAPDLAQYLQVIPGVVTTGDQGGQLYIRGGTPIMNKVLLDGAIIYNPFHSIGIFSIFDTDILRSVDVYTAGFPAEYGGRISSVMDIKTRNGDFKKIRAKIHANPFTGGVLLEGPLFKKKDADESGNSFLFTLRNSYIDQTSKSIYKSFLTDSNGLPYNFTDVFGKLTFGSEGNRANLFGFYQNDNALFNFPSDFRWTAAGGGLSFIALPASSNIIISGNFAYSNYGIKQKTTNELYERRSAINGFNGGLNFAYILNSKDELSFGLEFLGYGTDFQIANANGRPFRDKQSNTEASLFVKYKYLLRKLISNPNANTPGFFNRLVLEPGLQIHFYATGYTVLTTEPRLRAKFNLNNRFSIQGAVGRYSQNLMAATNDQDVVALFQGILFVPQGNRDRQILPNNNPLQIAWHYLLGTEFQLTSQFLLIVEGWYKNFQQLTNINRLVLFPQDPQFVTETGIANGFDIILKYQSRKLYIYATYDWSKITRTVQARSFDNVYYDDGSTNPQNQTTGQEQTYSPIFDRRHTANLVVNYKSGNLGRAARRFKESSSWEVSTRFALGSGLPFTQTQGYFERLNFNINGSQTDIVATNGFLGILFANDINAGRLPYFHRLDLTAKKRWLLLKEKVLLEANGGVYNTYNRANIFYFDRIRYARVNQLPLLPTAGISLAF